VHPAVETLKSAGVATCVAQGASAFTQLRFFAPQQQALDRPAAPVGVQDLPQGAKRSGNSNTSRAAQAAVPLLRGCDGHHAMPHFAVHA